MRMHIILGLLLLTGCQSTISGKIVDIEGHNVKAGQGGKVNLQSATDPSESHLVDINDDGTFQADVPIESEEYLIEPLIPGFKATSKKVSSKNIKDLLLEVEPTAKIQARRIDSHQNVDPQRGDGTVTLSPPQL
ncbi:MAG: hypothetical protein AB7T49_03080 [Oligoflexales bacterium]